MVIPVFFATDRTKLETEPLNYGADRAPRGALALGRMNISVPRDHRMAEIERPDIWTFWREDPSKHFVVVSRTEMSYLDFYGDLNSVIDRSVRKEVLVFIHGFNVRFEDGVYRTAQMAYDLGIDGAPILYSWPSEGSFVRYPVDLNNNEWTIPHLRWFLEDLGNKTNALKLHVIAHSMGNRALVNALNRLTTEPQIPAKVRFAQILLMAPDIDADVFSSLIGAVSKNAERTTLYASSNDEALKLSKEYQKYRRAGDSSPEITVTAGVDTVDVSALDTTLSGHSYYGDNKSVLSDAYYLLRDAKSPDQRFGLTSVGQPPKQWWVFRP